MRYTKALFTDNVLYISMAQPIKQKDAIIDYLLEQYPSCKLIYLFGSQLTKYANKDSDIDIAIWCGAKIDNLKRWDHAQTLAIRCHKDVDLVDLAACSLVLRYEVVTTGELWYDDGSSAVFDTATVSMYQNLSFYRQPRLDEYIKEKKHG